jgi:hypothetical protein
MSGLFDELIGTTAADPRVAEGLVRRAVRRAQRLAETGALPTGSIYGGQIEEARDTAAERMELAQRISEALASGDRTRAQRLIRTGGDLYGLAAMAAAVEGAPGQIERTPGRARSVPPGGGAIPRGRNGARSGPSAPHLGGIRGPG